MTATRKITEALIRSKRPSFRFQVYDDTPCTPLSKPLSACRLALITTGGLHRKDDTPFDLTIKNGDCSFRLLPSTFSRADLLISHRWYNHKFINADLNCVFPIDRMKEYEEKGIIGSLAPIHVSFMGHIYVADELERNAEKVGRILKEDNVHAVFITPT